MKGRSLILIVLSALLLLGLGGGIGGLWAEEPAPPGTRLLASPMGTAFTYQGRLVKDGNPVNGTCDFTFGLFDVETGGTPIDGALLSGVGVSNGLFTVQLDFGTGAFQGDARWLGIQVRCPAGGGSYTTLSPRQPLTATPYALHALSVADHDHLGQTWTGSDNPLVIEGTFGVPGRSAPLVLYNSASSGEGLLVSSAGDDGVHVNQAGNPSATSPTIQKSGFEVAGAQGYGVYVGRADLDGVYVNSAGGDGVTVGWAGDDGVHVYWATDDGVYVDWASDDGVYVDQAQDDGVYVDWAGGSGVVVNSADGAGVVVYSADGFAGFFNGTGYFAGLLTKAGGGFQIDHPQDPANKYLYHSFVESPDMMNIYNGNVTLDANGEAWVELPAWFEALNQEFRYQLTCIGGFAPVYVAQEIQNNRFKIAGGTPGMKVSWQVTGIRHDPWAEANRLPVDEEKPPEERDTYLHPELYGQPETKGYAYMEAYVEGHEQAAEER